MQAIIKELGGRPDAAIIWLHGLGDEGASFVSTIPYLKLPTALQVRFVFPSAPVRAVTVNNGMQMRSWYDIKAMLPQRVIDADQLDESVKSIEALVSEQIAAGIAPERIIVVGFSQGGALCYELGLKGVVKVGAIAAMSTYMPRMLEEKQCKADRSLSILTIHGDRDDVVPYALGQSAVTQLQKLGFSASWHSFPMAHEVSLESLTILGEWITNNLTSN
ncbi:MAG: dienelactone hydrolase family protein [Oceanospirillaceae bacterium]|nr:dienelactone hydrolase family protein [Oceanospirillaceae bacterium]